MNKEQVKNLIEFYTQTDPAKPEEAYLILIKRLCQLAIELAEIKHTEPLCEKFVVGIYKELTAFQPTIKAYIKIVQIITNDDAIQLSNEEEIVKILSV